MLGGRNKYRKLSKVFLQGSKMNITLITSILMDYAGIGLKPFSMDKIRSCPPYGVYLLAAILQKKGHNVVLIDLIEQGSLSLGEYISEIENSNVIGISATSLSWPSAKDIIIALKKKYPQKIIVLGGVHASIFDKYLLKTFPIDFIVRGEADEAFPLLIEALENKADIANVPNVSFRVGGKVVQTKLCKCVDMEEYNYPLPDYSNLKSNVYKGLAIESSRGCPFNCIFCSTLYRQSWRGIRPEAFVDRLIDISPFCSKTVIGCIQITDDEFTANWIRAKKIGDLLSKKRTNIPLIYDARANDLAHEEVVEALAPHTYRLLVGAECGYDQGLEKIGKGTTCERIQKAASILYKYGISEKCDFSFILGLPWERKEDILKTISFACNLYSTYGIRLILQWFYLIPGSSLWQKKANSGRITPSFYDNYGFFQNLYVFFEGVKLAPKDIYEITDRVMPIVKLAKINDYGENHIVYSHPSVVSSYFKRDSLDKSYTDSLQNLEKISMNVRMN